MNLAKPERAAPTANLTLRGAVAAAALLTTAALLPPALAQGVGAAGAAPSASAATLERYLADLDTALGLSSPAAESLALAVADARAVLRLARAGLGAVGAFEPVVEHVRDPATGEPLRSIIKTTDPEKYGIHVRDYFV